MAKSDSFFIRKTISTNGTTYAEDTIDTGAYVDALGKSVLRIHTLSVQYGSPTGVVGVGAAGGHSTTAFQITTQSQASMVSASDRSLVSSGRLIGGNEPASASLGFVNEHLDIAPQQWRNGYLVGVESLYLATDSVGNALVDEITVVMECTVETLSQSAAMALALSQQ